MDEEEARAKLEERNAALLSILSGSPVRPDATTALSLISIGVTMLAERGAPEDWMKETLLGMAEAAERRMARLRAQEQEGEA